MKKMLLILTLALIFSLSAGCSKGTPESPSESGANTATVEADVQKITTPLTSDGYPEITVQKGIPVEWTITATEEEITNCNNKLVIPAYDIEKPLVPGDNVISFTPTESGTIPYSCWMNMIKSQINVVDQL